MSRVNRQCKWDDTLHNYALVLGRFKRLLHFGANFLWSIEECSPIALYPWLGRDCAVDTSSSACAAPSPSRSYAGAGLIDVLSPEVVRADSTLSPVDVVSLFAVNCPTLISFVIEGDVTPFACRVATVTNSDSGVPRCRLFDIRRSVQVNPVPQWNPQDGFWEE